MNVHSFFVVSLYPKKYNMTKNKMLFWTIIKAIMAIFMLYGGIQHFVATAFYLPFVPGFLPFKMAIIYISGKRIMESTT